MPRRGSRPHRVHLLADSYAGAVKAVYGYRDVAPHDFYGLFRQLADDELEEMAANIEPRRRGRPSWATSRLSTDALVREVTRRLDHHSERRACEIVAEKWGMNPRAVRMRFRRAKKR